jgi:hypothetical protein
MKRALGNKPIQYSYDASKWTASAIAVYIKDTYGVNCSNFKLQKLFKEFGVCLLSETACIGRKSYIRKR